MRGESQGGHYAGNDWSATPCDGQEPPDRKEGWSGGEVIGTVHLESGERGSWEREQPRRGGGWAGKGRVQGGSQGKAGRNEGSREGGMGNGGDDGD